MPARRRTGLWIAGVLGIAVLAGLTARFVANGRSGGAAKPTAAAFDARTPMAELTRAVRESDARALTEIFRRSEVPADAPPKAIGAEEAADWVAVLESARAGYLKFGSFGRASVMAVTGRVLRRFAVEPAPTSWAAVLAPTHDLIATGLNDGALDVRIQALAEVGAIWSWSPGRSLTSSEEEAFASWKDNFITPVVRRLGDRDPKSRAAAVACLGRLPIDHAAAPAIASLEDPTAPEVRRQVLISFAQRRGLLSDEAVLRHVYDKEAGIPEIANLILKTRGLNQEQISLGSMIFHPKPEIRASVIALIKDRTDIDPAVWLLELSRDGEETVRLGAVEALAAKLTPEVGQRLAEMAATDASPAVRRAASKHLPEIEKTAALPPLPGSPSLNPKAN